MVIGVPGLNLFGHNVLSVHNESITVQQIVLCIYRTTRGRAATGARTVTKQRATIIGPASAIRPAR